MSEQVNMCNLPDAILSAYAEAVINRANKLVWFGNVCLSRDYSQSFVPIAATPRNS